MQQGMEYEMVQPASKWTHTLSTLTHKLISFIFIVSIKSRAETWNWAWLSSHWPVQAYDIIAFPFISKQEDTYWNQLLTGQHAAEKSGFTSAFTMLMGSICGQKRNHQWKYICYARNYLSYLHDKKIKVISSLPLAKSKVDELF